MGDSSNNTQNSTVVSPEGMAIAYSGLYLMALMCIVHGAFMSLRLVKKHRKEKKFMENSITFNDAKWFPVTASCVLFGLYCIFKRRECASFLLNSFDLVKSRIPEALGLKIEHFLSVAASNQSVSSNVTSERNYTGFLHTVLNACSGENFSYYMLVFFCWQGVFALAHLLRPVVSFMIQRFPKLMQKYIVGSQIQHYRISFTRSPVEKVDHENVKEEHEDPEEPRKQFMDIRFDSYDIISIILCAFVGFLHLYYRSWLTNNVFGLAFTLYGIEALHLSSFKAGCVLLSGLFVYDIFWVFATEVMSTVATKVNAPILLMFPQDLLINGLASNKFAMLGLGDIVIPGIFIALLLRYGEKHNTKSYFYFTILAYALGLMLTIFVMHYFKAAQPALLYLVPACLGAPLMLASIKGDLKTLISYDEQDLVKPEPFKNKQERQATKKKQ